MKYAPVSHPENRDRPSAVELRRGALGDDNPLVADALVNVAILHLGKQDFERAEPLVKQAISNYDKANRITANTAFVLETLTLLRWRVRDYHMAEFYGKRAIETNEKLYGDRSLQLLDSLHNLIRVYEADGRNEDANTLYLRILALAEARKDDIPDRLAQMLIIYRCSHRDARQAPAIQAIDRRIEEVLGWNPDLKQETVSEGILNGRALALPRPIYPDQARMARASGTVVVEVKIDECGKVVEANVRSGRPELRFVSVTAGMNARFSPTLVKGIPVGVNGIIHHNFIQR